MGSLLRFDHGPDDRYRTRGNRSCHARPRSGRSPSVTLVAPADGAAARAGDALSVASTVRGQSP